MRMITVELSNFQIITDLSVDPFRVMDEDRSLLINHTKLPTLRLYQWATPTISLGKLQNRENILSNSVDDVVVVQRPTGGRHIYHCGDLSFTIYLPYEHYGQWGKNVAELQASVGQLLTAVFEQCGIIADRSECISLVALRKSSIRSCFSTSVQNELLFRGKKITGTAFRIESNGALVQGTIPFTDEYLRICEYEQGSGDSITLKKELAQKSCSLQNIDSSVAVEMMISAFIDQFTLRMNYSG